MVWASALASLSALRFSAQFANFLERVQSLVSRFFLRHAVLRHELRRFCQTAGHDVLLRRKARLLPEEAILRPVRTLSGGMKRRVALARALLYDAPLLVLDEPFKGLDETTARQCMDALARRAAGRAVLLVTHDAQDGDYLHARTLQMEKLQRV